MQKLYFSLRKTSKEVDSKNMFLVIALHKYICIPVFEQVAKLAKLQSSHNKFELF